MENKKGWYSFRANYVGTLCQITIHEDVIMKAYEWLNVVLLKEVNCIWLQLRNLSFVSV